MNEKKRIVSFHDLDVYQSAYDASVIVLTQIIPKLPREERFDLADQLRRSAKAVPGLIAEAYSKRHQKRRLFYELEGRSWNLRIHQNP